MLIPKPVEMDFAISPKTGQRKTWLLRKNWMPQNRGPKKWNPQSKKWNPQAKKVESASKKSEVRIAASRKTHCGRLRLPSKKWNPHQEKWKPQSKTWKPQSWAVSPWALNRWYNALFGRYEPLNHYGLRRKFLMDDHMSSHPAARLFPLIKGDEFEALVDDIRENGQREPILLHPDGSILDGRNRYLACRKLGIEPKSEHWDGEGSPEEIVLSLNLHRRHLSSAQRAAIAVEILPKLEAEAKERQRLSRGRGKKGCQNSDNLFTSEQTSENNELNDDSKSEQKAKRTKGEDVYERSLDRAAKMFGTNRDYVDTARLIKDADPTLLKKVRDGEMKIAVAHRKLARRAFPTPKQARRIALAENRDVLARDGRRYGPPGEDPEKPPELDPSEQEVLAFVDAVVTLGTLTLGPDDLAGKVPSWRRDEVENHLGNAISCLWAFDNEWNQPDDDPPT